MLEYFAKHKLWAKYSDHLFCFASWCICLIFEWFALFRVTEQGSESSQVRGCLRASLLQCSVYLFISVISPYKHETIFRNVPISGKGPFYHGAFFIIHIESTRVSFLLRALCSPIHLLTISWAQYPAGKPLPRGSSCTCAEVSAGLIPALRGRTHPPLGSSALHGFTQERALKLFLKK